MNDKNLLGDFIFTLRKEKNLSQAELGELVGVTNKAVSKWETYEANPDLQIIPKLAEVLGVTADELLNCKKATQNDESVKESTFFGIKGDLCSDARHFEFVSERKTKKGTPYIHINLGKDENGKIRKAKGVVAVGIFSKGVLSLGIFSLGLLSMGIFSIGLLAMGVLSLGALVAVAGIAVGGLTAVGGVAVGTIAVGGVAVGVLSVGGLSIGIWAHTGELGKAIGKYIFFH